MRSTRKAHTKQGKGTMLPASITTSQSVLPFFLNCFKSHVPPTHLGSTKPTEPFTSSSATAATAEADPLLVPTELFSGGGGGITAVAAGSEVPEEAFKGERENKGRLLGRLRVRVKNKPLLLLLLLMLWVMRRWGLE